MPTAHEDWVVKGCFYQPHVTVQGLLTFLLDKNSAWRVGPRKTSLRTARRRALKMNATAQGRICYYVERIR